VIELKCGKRRSEPNDDYQRYLNGDPALTTPSKTASMKPAEKQSERAAFAL
jgi:hypothetical protein